MEPTSVGLRARVLILLIIILLALALITYLAIHTLGTPMGLVALLLGIATSVLVILYSRRGVS